MTGDEMISSFVQEKGFFGQAPCSGVWTPGLEEASLFGERRAWFFLHSFFLPSLRRL
jgi:hypothetical protein